MGKRLVLPGADFSASALNVVHAETTDYWKPLLDGLKNVPLYLLYANTLNQKTWSTVCFFAGAGSRIEYRSHNDNPVKEWDETIWWLPPAEARSRFARDLAPERAGVGDWTENVSKERHVDLGNVNYVLDDDGYNNFFLNTNMTDAHAEYEFKEDALVGLKMFFNADCNKMITNTYSAQSKIKSNITSVFLSFDVFLP